MTQKAKNRGQLIDIARSYLSGDNFVICREDIPQMIDDLISKVEILDIQRVAKAQRTVCPNCDEKMTPIASEHFCPCCFYTL